MPPTDTYNAVSLIVGGEIVGTYRKQDLPNAEVFDEKRYFATDAEPLVFELNGVKYGVIICEDAWHASAAQIAKAAGAQVLLIPNGSPYHEQGSGALRHPARTDPRNRVADGVREPRRRDELVFDGGSFVLDAQGALVAKMPQFDEGHAIVEFDGARPLPGAIAPELSTHAQVYRALVTGVRDYIGKNGFPGVLIGLSGGVDSALVLAVDAMRSGRSACARDDAVALHGRHLDHRRGGDGAARRRALRRDRDRADVRCVPRIARGRVRGPRGRRDGGEHPGTHSRHAADGAVEQVRLDRADDRQQERDGGRLLHAVRRHGRRVRGDQDIAKTLVYRLCRYRNETADYPLRDVIPERILTRAPSAELRENQTDSLPPYDVLDAIMRMYMEEDRPLAEIVAAGYAQADVERVTRLIKINEYKRRQAPIGIRVTHRAFGRDWRYPITSRLPNVSIERCWAACGPQA